MKQTYKMCIRDRSAREFRQEQAERLRQEGVEIKENCVDLKRFGWNGK